MIIGRWGADNLHGLNKFKSVPVGHLDITDNYIVTFTGGELKALMAIVHSIYLVTLFFEAFFL